MFFFVYHLNSHYDRFIFPWTYRQSHYIICIHNSIQIRAYLHQTIDNARQSCELCEYKSRSTAQLMRWTGCLSDEQWTVEQYEYLIVSFFSRFILLSIFFLVSFGEPQLWFWFYITIQVQWNQFAEQLYECLARGILKTVSH